MIIRFSENIWQRWYSILRNNKKPLTFFIIWAIIVYVLEYVLKLDYLSIPMGPVALMGGGLAIFLGFKNNSAYDRWWEARKIWGGMVNISRTFAMNVLSFTNGSDHELEAHQIVKRHLAFVYTLKNQLRNTSLEPEISLFLELEEVKAHLKRTNSAASILNRQAIHIAELKKRRVIDEFEHQILTKNLEQMFDYQGMSERIKKTIFPYFYKYFTSTFLWLFLFILPLSLVHEMSWHAIPLSVAISFVYMILDKVGDVTENPLDARSSGTPLNAICRTIEIDLLEQIEADNIPDLLPIKRTRHNSIFID